MNLFTIKKSSEYYIQFSRKSNPFKVVTKDGVIINFKDDDLNLGIDDLIADDWVPVRVDKNYNTAKYYRKTTKSDIANISSMFSGFHELVGVDTKGFESVTRADELFLGCNKLERVDTSGLVNVHYAKSMFNSCNNLKTIDTSHFQKVKNATNMFLDCIRLKTIDTSPFRNVQNASGMFDGCLSLTSIDLRPFEFATYTGNMLHGCEKLKTVIIPKDFPMYDSTLRGCCNLESIQYYGTRVDWLLHSYLPNNNAKVYCSNGVLI